MNKFHIIIIVPLIIISCSNHRSKYLNSKFAFDKRYKLEDNKNTLIPLADKFTEVGLFYYKQKQDLKAIEQYEKSLDMYPSANTYYYYGNSLTNIGENENSIKAYNIALELDYKNPELAFYNIACSYSKLKDFEKSIEYLKDAILSGYSMFNHILQDPDLIMLRNSNKWKIYYNDLLQLFNKGNSEFLIGNKITHGVASRMDAYVFCEEGNILVYYCISEHNKHHKIGNWNIKNYKINIHLNQEYGGRGIGDPIICGATCSYSKYQPFENHINENEVLSWYEIEKNKFKHWNVESYNYKCKYNDGDFIKLCH